jgi:hypothetical protein
MILRSKDDIALDRYGVPYVSLSGWGRSHVDKIAFREQASFAATLPLPTATEEVSVRQANIRLTAELEKANQEILDLWEQLSETKEELEKIRSEFNLPSS